MLHIKFHSNQPSGSGEDFLKGSSIYRHGSHLGHVTWTKYKQFFPILPRGCIRKLNEIGPMNLETKFFENVDRQQTSDLLPRSLNGLDL